MSPIVFVTCACGQKLRQPFSRYSGPVAVLHQRSPGSRHCRLVVTPDPNGHNHVVREVPRLLTIESFLISAIEKWRTQQAPS